MSKFKPMLGPNNEIGVDIDWFKRLRCPSDYLVSTKLDGIRVELYPDMVLGRSLKPPQSIQVSQMASDVQNIYRHEGIIEAEFWSPNMNLEEIKHFYKTVDVTSEKTLKKYKALWKKTGGDPAKGWKFPNRSVEWLCTWHPCLKFYAFDYLTNFDVTKENRIKQLVELHVNAELSAPTELEIIHQQVYESTEEILDEYATVLAEGYEGLYLIDKHSLYKTGRHTLKSGLCYKMKEDSVPFTCTIIGVDEATEAREGSLKTVNELGRSKTSQLKEDRVPAGYACGFRVRLEDGREMSIGISGFDSV